jgi:hypothetical protein
MRIRRLAPPDRQLIVDLLGSDSTFTGEELAVALELVDSAAARPDGDYRALVAGTPDGRVNNALNPLFNMEDIFDTGTQGFFNLKFIF